MGNTEKSTGEFSESLIFCCYSWTFKIEKGIPIKQWKSPAPKLEYQMLYFWTILCKFHLRIDLRFFAKVKQANRNCLLASVPDGPSIDPPSQGRSIDHLLEGTQPFFTIQYALHELTVKLFLLFNKQIDCRAWFHLVTLEVQTSFLPFVKQAFFFSKKYALVKHTKSVLNTVNPSFYHENTVVTVQCLLTKSSDSYYTKEVDQYWQ